MFPFVTGFTVDLLRFVPLIVVFFGFTVFLQQIMLLVCECMWWGGGGGGDYLHVLVH